MSSVFRFVRNVFSGGGGGGAQKAKILAPTSRLPSRRDPDSLAERRRRRAGFGKGRSGTDFTTFDETFTNTLLGE